MQRYWGWGESGEGAKETLEPPSSGLAPKGLEAGKQSCDGEGAEAAAGWVFGAGKYWSP